MMKKIFVVFAVILSICLFASCSGGGKTKTPLDPPKPEDNSSASSIGSTEWIRYENQKNRGEVIFIYMYIHDQATFAYYPDYYNCYYGPFEWESSDGKTVYAKSIKFDTNPNNYPTTGTLYKYDDLNKSYLNYNGKTFVFNGYQSGSKA